MSSCYHRCSLSYIDLHGVYQMYVLNFFSSCLGMKGSWYLLKCWPLLASCHCQWALLVHVHRPLSWLFHSDIFFGHTHEDQLSVRFLAFGFIRSQARTVRRSSMPITAQSWMPKLRWLHHGWEAVRSVWMFVHLCHADYAFAHSVDKPQLWIPSLRSGLCRKFFVYLKFPQSAQCVIRLSIS